MRSLMVLKTKRTWFKAGLATDTFLRALAPLVRKVSVARLIYKLDRGTENFCP